MNFNSIQFLIYLPVVTALYFLLPQRWRWVMLLGASYYFYMSWNPKLVFLIAFTTVVSYVAGLVMERVREDKRKRRITLTVTLCACLGVLFFFKYFNFLSNSVTGLLRAVRLPVDDLTLQLILPVGISFYTFQTLSYVIDVYRGTIPAERHFGYYALFVSFFPQLVAGPIERPQDLLPQLKAEHTFTRDNLIEGLKLLLCGFFKKVVVADGVATYVNAVYNAPETASGPAVALATVLFTFQVYCDFSGYTDIALGSARLIGIRLTQNFRLPFGSKSIQEFWTRWHVSLTGWFRDYVFYPLATNKKLSRKARKLGKKLGNRRLGIVLPQCVALFVTFVLSGLWHGAAWTFVLWGAIHGLYQVVEQLTDRPRQALWKRLHVNTEGRLYGWWRMALTFILCNFALIFFRANSVADLGVLLRALFTDWQLAGLLVSMELTGRRLVIIALSLVIMALVDLHFAQGRSLRQPEGGELVTAEGIAFLVMAIACAWLMLLGGDGASAFIYFQF